MSQIIGHEEILPIFTDEQRFSMNESIVYEYPPKCAEHAVLFKPEYPITPEEKCNFQQELEVEMCGFSEIHPIESESYLQRQYTSPKYMRARETLLKKKTKSGTRIGVQYIVSSNNSCRNIQQKEILIHDEMGEYIKVLYGKVCNMYDYDICVSKYCTCSNPKPPPVVNFENMDIYDIESGLFKRASITLDQNTYDELHAQFVQPTTEEFTMP